jgi:hypothetical protein
MNKEQDINAIACQFQIDDEFADATTHGSGHINDSYCVTLRICCPKARSPKPRSSEGGMLQSLTFIRAVRVDPDNPLSKVSAYSISLLAHSLSFFIVATCQLLPRIDLR